MGNLELFMVGLVVEGMARSVAFYRQLGVALPDGVEEKSHVEVKMSGGMTFFLDSRPERWDPAYRRPTRASDGTYSALLEFYLTDEAGVRAKFDEMTALGYDGFRPPYDTGFGMCFAFLRDPDGNAVLISGEL